MQVRYILLIVVLLALLLGAGLWFGRTFKPTHTGDMGGMQRKVIQAAGRSIRADLAVTEVQKERGLSGRTSLSDEEGMLFIFDTDGRHAFWMKDMRIAIDIVWIGADGSVVYIVPNLSPSTYPAVFAPDAPARYVLELSAGWTERHGLKAGDEVVL